MFDSNGLLDATLGGAKFMCARNGTSITGLVFFDQGALKPRGGTPGNSLWGCAARSSKS